MPKKKGSAAASPAANKRQQTPSAKRVPARRRRDTLEAAAQEQAEEAAAIGGGGEVSGSPGKEGVTGSVARGEAAPVVAEEEAEVGSRGAAPSGPAEQEVQAAAEMAVDAAVLEGDSGGLLGREEVNGSVVLEEAAAMAAQMEVEEELDAAVSVGFPEKDLEAHETDKAEGAVDTSMVDGGSVGCVDELRGLSTALSAFTHCWDDLSHHLNSIQGSMDALARVFDGHHPLTLSLEGKQRQESMMGRGTDEKKVAGEGGVEEKKDGDSKGAEETKKPEQAKQPSLMDLKSICEKMLGRNLRRYVVSHMSEVDQLREEVPQALRLAPDPARLVLSCVGRFYRQGSRAYADPNSPMVSVRRACILVLEFFILSGCLSSCGDHLSSSSSDVTIADSAPTEAVGGKEASTSVKAEAKVVAIAVSKPTETIEGDEALTSAKEEATVSAIAWKNRLVAEGGVASASAVDALGLALFVASFGIPSDFDSEMMYDIFRLCNMKKKARILCQSPIIAEKLPDIIQDLVHKEKYIAAADLVCGFGLQEKYPPLDLISSFLIKTNAVAKDERREGQCSFRSLKEATTNQLAAYKSVVKCLEDYKLNPSSLTSFRIDDKISKLERDLAKFDKKLNDNNMKRKAENVGLTNEVKAPAKRTVSTPAGATSGRFPPQVKPTQDHGRILSISKNLYDGSGNRFSDLLDRSGSGNVAGKFGGGLAATAGYFTGNVGNSLRHSIENSGASYGWYQEGGLGDSFVRHSSVGLGHSEQKGLLGSLATQNVLQLPASPLGMGSRASGSNLYEFADNVMENDSYYHRSVQSNALPNSASGYHSSYFN